jgi:signal recognition particle subunit SEC65
MLPRHQNRFLYTCNLLLLALIQSWGRFVRSTLALMRPACSELKKKAREHEARVAGQLENLKNPRFERQADVCKDAR